MKLSEEEEAYILLLGYKRCKACQGSPMHWIGPTHNGTEAWTPKEIKEMLNGK